MLQHKQQSFTSTGNFLPEGSRKGHLDRDSIKKTKITMNVATQTIILYFYCETPCLKEVGEDI